MLGLGDPITPVRMDWGLINLKWVRRRTASNNVEMNLIWDIGQAMEGA